MWWSNIKQDDHFIMQEHKVGLPVWPYKYRISLRENRMEIANSNDREEILRDWDYLQSHAVPQINESIDVGKTLKDIDYVGIVKEVVSVYRGIGQ